MKRASVFELCSYLLLIVVCMPVWFGCASIGARDTESLLSAAGFHTVTPSTPAERAWFQALPAYKIKRQEKNGKVIYAFADKKEGVIYVGGENEYARFQQFALETIPNRQLRDRGWIEQGAPWSFSKALTPTALLRRIANFSQHSGRPVVSACCACGCVAGSRRGGAAGAVCRLEVGAATEV